jgi:hypothetical protein
MGPPPFPAKILSREPAARFKLRVGAKVNDARAQEPLGLLADTWFVAIQPLGSKIIQIEQKLPFGVSPQVMQKLPGKKAGVVHVIKADAHRVISDGINREDHHIAFSPDRLALCFGVALEFGGRAGHSEQFRGELKACAIVKHDVQCTTILREPDFNWPGLRHDRLSHLPISVRAFDDKHGRAVSIPTLPQDTPMGRKQNETSLASDPAHFTLQDA